MRDDIPRVDGPVQWRRLEQARRDEKRRVYKEVAITAIMIFLAIIGAFWLGRATAATAPAISVRTSDGGMLMLAAPCRIGDLSLGVPGGTITAAVDCRPDTISDGGFE